MKKKSKYLVLTVIALAVFAVITFGVTYSFFNYMREGSTENTIRSGSISFIYEEVNKMGNGIKIEDALPVSDTDGKASNYFEFKVKSSSAPTIAIPYEITTRVTDGSDDISNYVKVYLTKVNGTNEEQKVLSIYSSLNDSTNRLAAQHGDKTLYEGEIPVGSTNYTETYRLRMWLNNDTNDGSVLDYSPVYQCSDTNYTTQETCESNNGVWNPTEAYNNQNKTFSIKVNVYADGENASSEKIISAASTTLNSVSSNNVALTQNTNTSLNYDYSTSVSNSTESISFDIEPSSPGATVNVESITEQQATALRTSTTQSFPLSEGDNYFKVTVTSANRQNSEVYVLKVNRRVATISVQLFGNTIEATTDVPTLTGPSTLCDSSFSECTEIDSSGLYVSYATNSGNPTYYFRGNVTNNYVDFAGFTWRVVRINEDGTIRLILDRPIDEKLYKLNNSYNSYTQMYYSAGIDNAVSNYPNARYTLENWYVNNIESNENYRGKIADKSGNYFCEAAKVVKNDSSSFYNTREGTTQMVSFDSDYVPTFTCIEDQNGHQFVDTNIGLITLDETIFAGAYLSVSKNNAIYLNLTNYVMGTMSPAGVTTSRYSWQDNVAKTWTVSSSGVSTLEVNAISVPSYRLFPIINLKADTMATIDSETGHYVVSE